MVTRDIYESGFDEDVRTVSSANQCPECDGRDTTNAVETACEDCGLVIDEQRIDHGPEWHVDEEDERRRTSAPLTAARHDRGLLIRIGSGQDAAGRELDPEKRLRLTRLRPEYARGRWQSTQDRSLGHGLTEIRRIASTLSLPASVRDQACQLFRTAQNEGPLPGRSIEAMAAASIFAVCRCNGHSRLIADVAPVVQVAQSRVEIAYKVLNEALGLPTSPMRPTQFVQRLESELGSNDAVQHDATRLAEQAVDAGITDGLHPAGFAAACLYMAACANDVPLTQADAAAAVEVTIETVRAHRDRLLSVVE